MSDHARLTKDYLVFLVVFLVVFLTAFLAGFFAGFIFTSSCKHYLDNTGPTSSA